MCSREGLVRRYGAGLVLETVPSYAVAHGIRPRPLPGVLRRNPASAERSGALVLRQALALLTGRAHPVVRIANTIDLLRQGQRLLPGYAVQGWPGSDAATVLTAVAQALRSGGLALLQWQPLVIGAAAHWLLVLGIESPWRANASALTEEPPTALLALGSTVPAVWGSGHNRWLAPQDPAKTVDTEAARPLWTARTLDGGFEHGTIVALVTLQPAWAGTGAA